MRFVIRLTLVFSLLLSGLLLFSQDIPKVYKNIFYDAQLKNYYIKKPSDSIKLYADTNKSAYRLPYFTAIPQPYDSGFILNSTTTFSGNVLFGLIDTKNTLQKVVYSRSLYAVHNGVARLNIVKALSDLLDITNWKKSGKGKIGYRYFSNSGSIIFDGSFVFDYKNKQFSLDTCFAENPSVCKVTDHSATIRFTTNFPVKPFISITNMSQQKTFTGTYGTVHEIELTGLQSDTPYHYLIQMGDYSERASFKTFPAEGAQTPFVFGYASDCRSGQGGNERAIMGVNSFVMSRIAALLVYENARFAQITGDLITGYTSDEQRTNLEYQSYKNSIAPWSRQIPFYMGMGNHESVAMQFKPWTYAVDKFPFNVCSQEKIFADNFVNPENGPTSEDGSKLDPDPQTTDFPSYSENVYYYTCGNVAMIVLNSEYLYNNNEDDISALGGNIHGYIMDNQMLWLSETLIKLENNKSIDHIFVSFHAPALPNGGHVSDAMYYKCNDEMRPIIGNKTAEIGIVQRRDELLNLLINKTTKVDAILVGDEHNYSRTLISPETNLYDTTYNGFHLKLNRSIWQITNGAAGAPYYAKENAPWSASVEKFAVQYALCLFYVDGKQISMKVVNPETLETIEEIKIK